MGSDPRQEAARESEKEALILEKQLEAVLDGLNQGDGVGDTKRAMVGSLALSPISPVGRSTRGITPSLQPSSRPQLLVPSLQFLALAIAIIELLKSQKKGRSPSIRPME